MLIKSAVLSQASGSLAGATFAHNRGGMYVRARSIPTNPASNFQLAIRQALTTLSHRWSAILDATARAAWTDYAAATPQVNPLGDQLILTGQQMFVRNNVPRLLAGLSIVNDAPASPGDATLSPTTAEVNPGEPTAAQIGITFNNADAWATAVGGALLIFDAPDQSPAVNFYKGPFRYAGKITGAATPPTSPGSVDNVFQHSTGNAAFVRVIAVTADGRLSPAAIMRTIVSV